MANFKFVKSATAAVLGASVLTTAVVVPGADASAKTTYKVNKYGYLVNAKTNKKVNGYKTYKGKLYKNGKKFTGKTSYGTYYVKGKKFTGKTKYGYYYVNGKRFTGTTKYGYYYVNGKRFNGKTKYGNLYVNGKRYTGTTKYGYTYYNGKRVEGEYKAKVYTNGKLVTGLYKEKLYNKGVLETGLDLYKDKLYKDGVLNVGYALYNNELYKDGVLNVGYALYNNELYKDTVKNVGFIADPLKDGKAYYDALLANGTYDVEGVEKAFEDGIEVGAKVKSVEAINGKQLKVTFNKSVNETDAETVANYTVTKLNGGAVNLNAVNGVGATLKSDNRTVILTFDTDSFGVSTDLVVAVDDQIKLANSIKETVPKFSTVVNVNDTTAPTIASVLATTNTDNAQSVYVAFDEPIDVSKASFKIDGETVTAGVTPNALETGVTIAGLDLEAGKSHTVSIVNAEDYAGNKAATILSKDFTITKDTTVATGKVVSVQDNKIKVTFDKAMNAASLSKVELYTYASGTGYTPLAAGADYTVPGASDDKDGKVWTFKLTNGAAISSFFGTNDTTEDVLVKVPKTVVDSNGNSITAFDSTVTLKQDTVGPTLQSVTFDKDSNGAVKKLYFTFDELLSSKVAALAAANVAVKNTATNQTVDIADLIGQNNTTALASDGKTLIVTLGNLKADGLTALPALKEGSYSFEIQTGANFVVKDDADATNANNKVSKTVNFGTVTNKVTAAPSIAGAFNAQVLTVVFDKPVTAASAINPANYVIAGKALPSDTEIVYNAASTTATIALPANTIAKTDTEATLAINNIKPVDTTATFQNYLDIVSVLDNTSPIVTTSLLATGNASLAFSEDVAGATPKSDIAALKINGLEVNSGQYALTAVAKDTTTGKFTTILSVATVQDTVDGITYLFIDVDGDGNYNPDKDIKLNSTTGVAPTTWPTTVDLNSSLIKSVTLTTGATPSVVKDTTGNTLAGNSVITIK